MFDVKWCSVSVPVLNDFEFVAFASIYDFVNRTDLVDFVTLAVDALFVPLREGGGGRGEAKREAEGFES